MRHLTSLTLFAPWPLARIFAVCQACCLGYSSSKSKQTSETWVDSSTKTSTTNQQTAAAENSLAIGAEAEAFFDSSSHFDDHSTFVEGGVVQGGEGDIQSGDGIFGGDGTMAIGGVVGGSGDIHIESMERESLKDIVDFGYAALDRAAEMGMVSQEAANQLSRVTNEQMAAVVSEKAEDSASQVLKELQASAVKVGMILAAVVLIWRMTK